MSSTTIIPGTELRISKVAFGAASIAGLYTPVDEAQGIATVQRALDLGINYFDSALLYGGGKSLKLLGEGLGEHPPKDLVISFKVGRVLVNDRDDPDAKGKTLHTVSGFSSQEPIYYYYDYSAEGVRKAFEQSLECLNERRAAKGWKPLTPDNTNFVVFVHDPGVGEHGDKQPAIMRQVLAETYPALWKMQQQNKIKAYGVGTNEIAPCLASLKDPHICLMLLAGRFTLLCNGAPEASEQIKRDSQNLHLLLEGLRKHPNKPKIISASIGNSGLGYGGDTYNYGPADGETCQFRDVMVMVVDGFNHEHGTKLTLPDLMVQYPLSAGNSEIAAVMPGPRSPQEVELTCRALSTHVPDELWGSLREMGLINQRIAIKNGVAQATWRQF